MERSRRLCAPLNKIGDAKGRLSRLQAHQRANHGFLAGPIENDPVRIEHALTGSFTLDVYGHTLDWKSNEDAAQRLADEIANAVREADSNLDSGP